jgi:hypothetical protein
MQDRIARIDETSCTARPDHTWGSKCEELMLSISRPLLPPKAAVARTLLDFAFVPDSD